MNKHTQTLWQLYIETPRHGSSLVKIDVILEQRLKEFLLSRRRQEWLKTGR
ncbi:MAG: hypothetical protein ACHQTE_02505 [Candidatus Saccharimonadales bacterium]